MTFQKITSYLIRICWISFYIKTPINYFEISFFELPVRPRRTFNFTPNMDSNGIIPDVVDAVPDQIATVTFPSGATVEVGKELTPTQTKDAPNVTWEAEADGIYNVVMVDPDSPSRADPKMGELIHWQVINIPGNDLSKGQTIIEYVGPVPSKDSGLHRYIIWVFKQKSQFPTDRFVSKTTREGRPNNKTRDFITKYHLGNPIAGNYFLAQYDSYVDAIFASFKKQ